MKLSALFLLGLLMAVPISYAQDASSSDGFDLFFGIDTAVEKIQLAFARSPEAKVNLHLKFTQERLEELQQADLTEADFNRRLNNIQQQQEDIMFLIPDTNHETQLAITADSKTSLEALHDLEVRMPTNTNLDVTIDSVEGQAASIRETELRNAAILHQIDLVFPAFKSLSQRDAFVQEVLKPYSRIDFLISEDQGRTLVVKDSMLESIGPLQSEGKADLTVKVTSSDMDKITVALQKNRVGDAIKALGQADVSPLKEQVRIAGLVIAEGRNLNSTSAVARAQTEIDY